MHGVRDRRAEDHARLRRAPVCRRARSSADARRARGMGERATRRARTLPHLRPRDHGRRRARHPPPSRTARHRAARSALGVRRRPSVNPASRELRLPVLTGRAWAFADGLGAEDILPLRFATLAPVDAARGLFADLDATLASRLAAGDVLVAGQNLGHGAGGAAAARALAAAGLIAAVARSFAPGFADELLAA